VNKEEGLLDSRSNATGDFDFPALKGFSSTKGNKWRHRMKTSALGDSGADASLSLDSESNTSFIRSGFPGVCVCVCRCVFGFGFCFSFSSGSCFFRFGI